MIKWVDCINARNHPKASAGDVRINSTKFHNKEYISVSFIEGLAQKITNGDERMMVGFDYNTMKVFFRPPFSNEIGYKISIAGQHGKRQRVQFPMPKEWTAALLKSTYKIEHDPVSNLYYVDLCKKLDKNGGK